MIEIAYDTEKEHIFSFNYELHKYIPDSIFEEYSEKIELHFIQKLFAVDSYIQFIGEFQMIWSTHYKYTYMNKGFILVLDDDYDIINYAVVNPKDRSEIAEYISKLIANEKSNP